MSVYQYRDRITEVLNTIWSSHSHNIAAAITVYAAYERSLRR